MIGSFAPEASAAQSGAFFQKSWVAHTIHDRLPPIGARRRRPQLRIASRPQSEITSARRKGHFVRG